MCVCVCVCVCVNQEQIRSGGYESFSGGIMVQVNIIIIFMYSILYTGCRKKKKNATADNDMANRYFFLVSARLPRGYTRCLVNIT